MVSSLDGRATSSDGKVSGLGGAEDRAVMRSLRSRFDAVMIGAGTLRAEKISPNADPPEAPQPLPVILTNSGDVPLENLLSPAHTPLVILPEGVSKHEKGALSARTRTIPNKDFLRSACELLIEEYSVRALLLEGGPTLNRAFLSEDLADELLLTLAPTLIGGYPDSLTILSGEFLKEPPRPELVSVYLASDRLFLRYSLPGC